MSPEDYEKQVELIEAEMVEAERNASIGIWRASVSMYAWGIAALAIGLTMRGFAEGVADWQVVLVYIGAGLIGAYAFLTDSQERRKLKLNMARIKEARLALLEAPEDEEE